MKKEYLSSNPIPSSDTEIPWFLLGLLERTHKNKMTTRNRHYRHLNPLLNHSSKLSATNKLTIYKTILAPIWPHRIELSIVAKPSNIQ